MNDLKEKERGILCKLDIEKAYDCINWKFLFRVFQKIGFGRKWVNWVNWCITTASFSVLVNGSLEGFLKSTRGFRQGDPLSSCLFVLGMEVFSLLVDKIAFEGFLFGYKIVNKNGNEVKITHLLFVDDTLVFCEDSRE